MSERHTVSARFRAPPLSIDVDLEVRCVLEPAEPDAGLHEAFSFDAVRVRVSPPLLRFLLDTEADGFSAHIDTVAPFDMWVHLDRVAIADGWLTLDDDELEDALNDYLLSAARSERAAA